MEKTSEDQKRDNVLKAMLATPPQPKKPSQNKKLDSKTNNATAKIKRAK